MNRLFSFARRGAASVASITASLTSTIEQLEAHAANMVEMEAAHIAEATRRTAAAAEARAEAELAEVVKGNLSSLFTR